MKIVTSDCPTLEDLRLWLNKNKIDTHMWNKGEAKSVEDLWQEVVNKKCYLGGTSPLRYITAVQLVVVQQDKVLLEEKQSLRDARVRIRNRLPAEKLQPDEDPFAAASRCLAEELPLLDKRNTLIPEQQTRLRLELVDSESYPGLTTLYKLYRVRVHVQRLPNHRFTSLETGHQRSSPVVDHSWCWTSWSQAQYRGLI